MFLSWFLIPHAQCIQKEGRNKWMTSCLSTDGNTECQHRNTYIQATEELHQAVIWDSTCNQKIGGATNLHWLNVLTYLDYFCHHRKLLQSLSIPKLLVTKTNETNGHMLPLAILSVLFHISVFQCIVKSELQMATSQWII